MTISPDEPEPNLWRQTRGVIIKSARVGERVGKPLQEPAHVTPRYPEGIKNSDLQYVDQIIQRETALWWFHMNLEPYKVSTHGGAWGGYSGGLNSAPLNTLSYNGVGRYGRPPCKRWLSCKLNLVASCRMK